MKYSNRAILTSILGLVFLSTSGAVAATAQKITFPDVQEAGFDADMVQLAISNVKVARKLAEENIDRTYTDTDLSDAFKTYREKFLKITNADQLEAFLAEADAAYDTLPDDLKYFVAQAQLIRPFRSVVYRLRPIFEHDKAIQSSAVTVLRSLASSLMIYLPTDQWEAGFAYVTTPSADHDDTNVQFHQISDFQNFLMSASQNFSKQSHRIAAIYKARVKNHDTSALLWDNKLLYGLGGFDDGLDRYRSLGDAELTASLSGIHATLQGIAAFCAYNQDDLLDVAQDLGHLAGLNGFAFLARLEGEDVGVSAADRTKIFRKSKYKKFMTLRGPHATTNSNDSGADLLAQSFHHLKASVKYAEASWNVLQGSQPRAQQFFNPLLFQGTKREGTLRFKNLNAMLNSRTTLRGIVTGETSEVDLPNFFLKNPPQDLKAFLPTEFDDTKETVDLKTNSGAKLSYHNYFRGRATGWNFVTWKIISPDVSTSQNVATRLRVLRQSWGGDYLSPVLDFVAQ